MKWRKETIVSGRDILSMEKATEIRALFASGEWYKQDLARKFGVSPEAITLILRNKRWKDDLYWPPPPAPPPAAVLKMLQKHKMVDKGRRARARILTYLQEHADAEGVTSAGLVAGVGVPALRSVNHHLRMLETEGKVQFVGKQPRRVRLVRKE